MNEAVNDAARRRLAERHCAAALRAVAGWPADGRQNRLLARPAEAVLTREGKVPHLTAAAGAEQADFAEDFTQRRRGVADALALRLRHSDAALHRELQRALRPRGGAVATAAMATMIFDILEQLRCEALGAGQWAGLRRNLDAAFGRWCRAARGAGLAESEIGLLIYGVTHIARARLGGRLEEEVEGIIESVRFHLAPVAGADLARLRPLMACQREFAGAARGIAEAVAAIAEELAEALGGERADAHLAALRARRLLPPAEAADERYVEAGQGGPEARAAGGAGGGYQVFTRDFDRELRGAELYRLEQRRRLRRELDQLIKAQPVGMAGLARRLRRQFARPRLAGWHEGEEQGVIDGRRLSQLVSSARYRRVFKQEKQELDGDAVVTFLVDNSGSLKRRRFAQVAALVDVLARALELAGVKSEILGFTTGGWAGGRALAAWRQAGCPANPGRLGERLHIVYKSADAGWRRSRDSIAAMLNPLHYRESLDGEALEWAARRLLARPERGKFLTLISDGAPMDAATSHHNPPGFMERHLRATAAALERGRQIELGALAIDLDMNDCVARSVQVDLSGTLGNRTFRALETLFAGRATGAAPIVRL